MSSLESRLEAYWKAGNGGSPPHLSRAGGDNLQNVAVKEESICASLAAAARAAQKSPSTATFSPSTAVGQEFEITDAYREKTLAEIPDMIFDPVKQRLCAMKSNSNSAILDVEEDERYREAENPWSDAEIVIFLAKFMEHPKEFWKIAAYLKNKTTNDCVLFYYNFKKRTDLKALLKQQLTIRNAQRNNKDITGSNDDAPRFAHLGAAGEHRSLMRTSAWMCLADAARDLGVHLPANAVLPSGEGRENDASVATCSSLSELLKDAGYAVDWPSDHWTRHRKDPATQQKYAEKKVCLRRQMAHGGRPCNI